MRASFSGEWPILRAPQETSLPGTTKAKLAPSLHTPHPWQEMPHKDSKMRLAAELGPRGRTLQEQFPDAPTWAQSQKQCQSGCQLWPHQPLDGKLGGESSKPTSTPKLGMPLVRLPFCVGTAVQSEPSQKFLSLQKMGPLEITLENKISLYKCLHTLSEACFQRALLRNSPKGRFCHAQDLRLGKKSQLTTIVK
jgi:hypothetical protein